MVWYVTTPWSRIFPEKLTGSELVKKIPHFKEPQCSLPHSQAPVTCPYPEPQQSNQQRLEPSISRLRVYSLTLTSAYRIRTLICVTKRQQHYKSLASNHVAIIVSLGKTALSHRKSASPGTFYDSCGAQGQDKSDTCVTHYEVTQTLITIHIKQYIIITRAKSV
jgi:hypothetical protein